MYGRLKDMKLEPTLVTYNTLLAGLGKEGRTKEANELFTAMISNGCHPNTVTYNTLVDCLCRSDEVDLAIEKFSEMGFMNCFPDLVTYNSLIHGSTKENRMNDAFVLFFQMQKVLFPDCVTICTFIPGMVKNSRVEDALKIIEIFMSHVQRHVEPSFWEDLMSGILVKNDLDKSMAFAESLMSTEVYRDASVFVPLFKVLSKRRTLEAYNFFVKTRSYIGHAKLEVYNILIGGLVDVGLSEMAWNLFEEMRNSGCAPNVSTYNFLLPMCPRCVNV